MDKTFTSSEVREFVAQWRERALTVSEKFAVMAMISAYADRLEADEKTQAQRGVWVLVPREPTEGMLKAAEDAVDAASNCESTTDDLSALAYKAALAAAPQPQAAEPVMYTWSKEPDKDGVFRKIPLYTHPQPAQDAKDAKDARRWQQLCIRIDEDSLPEETIIDWIDDALNLGSGALNQCVDDDIAAMAGESGR